ncbi:hypothetical protein M422DRAFT_36009 [Sphaerobolus stellatus SS14]|uniref:Uncharacterized protein n=1 Tax=Sphaerobolus stellatus (strain SS14) TaxID=990650 RepID=A0A0C9USA1_SPHS4|nr:hypothetical protein M422DRAFT_36009 [Sphaerobolus stellatus SS14]
MAQAAELLANRFEFLAANAPHFEASWYGPIDKLLNTVFHDPEFMVKPQPRFRQSPSAPSSQASTQSAHSQVSTTTTGTAESSEQSVQVSLDSYNAKITKKPGAASRIPDFAVVKLGEDANHCPNDVPVIVMEIKKDGEDINQYGARGAPA